MDAQYARRHPAPPTLRLTRVNRTLRSALTGATTLMLAACASVSPLTPSPAPAAVASDEPFTIEGRLSARHDTDAITANFTWRHNGAQDELSVTTPLGQQIAELHGDTRAGRVEVRTADGKRDAAPE